jgi:hypothetical protein
MAAAALGVASIVGLFLFPAAQKEIALTESA